MAHLYPLNSSEKLTFFYNVASFTLWFCCFVRFLILLPLVGRRFLPGGIADFFHVVSVLPLVGYFVIKCFVNGTFNSKTVWQLINGIKSVWLTYGIIFPHPRIAKHISYSFLIFAWCVANIIHYAYYAFKVKTRSTPYNLLWLEYHHFYVTFPIAFAAELIQVFLSLGFVTESSWHEILLKGTFLGYFPVAYFFWNYLHSERKKRFLDIKAKIDNARVGDGLETSTSQTTATRAGENIELRTFPHITNVQS